MGIQVIAVDTTSDKLMHCLQEGADFALSAHNEDLVKQILRHSDGGSHGVLCIAPSTQVFDTAMSVVRPRGVIVALGLPQGSFPCSGRSIHNK